MRTQRSAFETLAVVAVAVLTATALPAVASAATPAPTLLLPHYQVEVDNPDGLTTLMAVRNESGAVQELTASFFNSHGMLDATMTFSLAPHAVKTFNLRDVTELEPDVDGFTRGYAVVEPTAGPGAAVIGGDYFRVEPDEDFATGGALVDLSTAQCQNWTARYLNGGPFDGGTLFTFYVDEPQGIELTDPPTLLGIVYDEDGFAVGDFELRTAFHSFTLPATGFPFDDSAFGTVELSFNGTVGVVLADHRASGRFSVGAEATCVDGTF
jgi:hypothetical protein